MRYIDHIRNMSDDQLAYFLNAIQPEITLWSLSMMRALSRKPYKGVDALNGTNGDTRTLMSILYKDFDYEMKNRTQYINIKNFGGLINALPIDIDTEDNKFYVIKTVKEISEEEAKFIRDKQQELRKKRQKRRKKQREEL